MFNFYDSVMSWWETVGPTVAIIFIFGSFVLFLLSLVFPNILSAWVTWAVGAVLLAFAFIFAEVSGIIWGLILFIAGVTWVFLLVLTVFRLWSYYGGGGEFEEPCRVPSGGDCDNENNRPNPIFEPIMRMFNNGVNNSSEKQAVAQESSSVKRRNNFNSQSAGDSYAN